MRSVERVDDNRAFRRTPSLGAQLEGTMFDMPAPSAPGSASSARAAACVSNPVRAVNHRKILACFPTGRPISMAEISERTQLPINIVTARLSELRPTWVERHDLACESRVKKNLRVDGYTLTAAGRTALHDHIDLLDARKRATHPTHP